MSDICNDPFDFNSRQDAVEVLEVVLDNLRGTSVLANDLVSNTLRTPIVTSVINYCGKVSVRRL